MSGHTPGPWLASPAPWPKGPSASIEIHSKDGDWIGSIHGDHAIVEGAPVRGFPSNDSGESNARLIVAAPDLLTRADEMDDYLAAMLEQIQADPNFRPDPDDLRAEINASRAVNSRARGV